MYAIEAHGLSERRACRTVNLNRCTFRYPARQVEDPEIAQELRERVATSFSVDTMVEGVLSAYRQALGEPAMMVATELAPKQ